MEYNTYYWMATTQAALQNALLDSNNCVYPNLGVVQGGVSQLIPDNSTPVNMVPSGIVYGSSLYWYTTLRSMDTLSTPAGLLVAAQSDCEGLLGVFL